MKAKPLLIASLIFFPQNAAVSADTVFTEKDFYFDDKTRPHKSVIVKGVNKVHRENSQCKDIDPSSAYISGGKGTKNNPVFFVTCGKGMNVHNVFFSKSDVEDDRAISAVEPVSRATAIAACSDAVKASAMFPSTVGVHLFSGTSVNTHANGRATVVMNFDAKNAIGNELPYQAKCLIMPDGKVEDINIGGR